MNRESAIRKINALRKMTTDRGCTTHEAATAQRLANALAKKWSAPNFEAQFTKDEHAAAMQFAWEYRKCGKSSCWCSRSATGRGHGPYKYRKQRDKKTVRSIYVRT